MERDSLQSAVGKQDRAIAGLTCFVIMPFGLKTDPQTGDQVDLDATYRDLIEPTISHLGLKCIRSDKVSQAGLIHKEMLDHIVNSDVAIVDITTGNPNVMYELGVRHAARKSGTIIIRQKGSRLPFNISGMRAMDYDLSGGDETEHQARIAFSRSLLETNIRNSLIERNVDSLVHTLLPGLNVARPPKPIPIRSTRSFAVPDHERKSIEIITGDITNVDTIDVWVNPENTRMEMGRLHDSSVSAIIRYYGAKKDSRGNVVDDTIVRNLQAAIGKTNWSAVEAGAIICTTAGQLEKSNNVKLIVHVAAQHGEPTQGYSTIRGYVRCMTNVLDEIDRRNSRRRMLGNEKPLRSVLFSLFGTRSANLDPQDITYDLVRAAIEYFKTWPDTLVDRVAFLAYTDADLDLCLTAVQRNGLEQST